MARYHSKRRHALQGLSVALGIASALLLVPRSVSAQEELSWARVDFLRNRVQFIPREQRARRARISDVLSLGDALRTARASRAELRFNDGSLARIGERATFRFTPNTRNFQLSDGTILLLIPPGRGRSTIQTPNAVTGIQGSALFVRYIPETDTTIVGALTNNPEGPMVLFNRDGSEQQALRANEIGVIQGDQITQLYEFDGQLFWQSSGLAEGFNYLEDASSTGSDALDAVRQEIRDAIASQNPLDGDSIIENPDTFSRPESPVEAAPPAPPTPQPPAGSTTAPARTGTDSETDDSSSLGSLPAELPGTEEEIEPAPALVFEGTPAEEYLKPSVEPIEEELLEVGQSNALETAETESQNEVPDSTSEVSAGESPIEEASATTDAEDVDPAVVVEPLPLPVTEDASDVPSAIQEQQAEESTESDDDSAELVAPPETATESTTDNEPAVDGLETADPGEGSSSPDAPAGGPTLLPEDAVNPTNEQPVGEAEVPILPAEATVPVTEVESAVTDAVPDTVTDTVIEPEAIAPQIDTTAPDTTAPEPEQVAAPSEPPELHDSNSLELIDRPETGGVIGTPVESDVGEVVAPTAAENPAAEPATDEASQVETPSDIPSETIPSDTVAPETVPADIEQPNIEPPDSTPDIDLDLQPELTPVELPASELESAAPPDEPVSLPVDIDSEIVIPDPPSPADGSDMPPANPMDEIPPADTPAEMPPDSMPGEGPSAEPNVPEQPGETPEGPENNEDGRILL